jgi:predicted O-methyltransferase YrrM
MFRKYKRLLIYKLKKKINIDIDVNTENETLDNLFNFYGSDKAEHWNAGKGHGYSKFYNDELKEKKKDTINILEIGSYSGSSAAAFSKYFVNSKIFCLDINITNFKYKSKKINVYGIDITQKREIVNFFKAIEQNSNKPYFDIIIDDGSHKLHDILFAFNIFFKNLKSNGTYVIEDFGYPKYFDHLNDRNEIKVENFLNNLKNKNFFNSLIISKEDQVFLMDNVDSIKTYKGNSKGADIAFIKKV